MERTRRNTILVCAAIQFVCGLLVGFTYPIGWVVCACGAMQGATILIKMKSERNKF